MENKGWVLASGRIVQSKVGCEDQVIAELSYKETRYNLRRVFVTREWIVTMLDGARGYGKTRREVVAYALWKNAEKVLDSLDLD